MFCNRVCSKYHGYSWKHYDTVHLYDADWPGELLKQKCRTFLQSLKMYRFEAGFFNGGPTFPPGKSYIRKTVTSVLRLLPLMKY